jgi:hypothetical protein
MRAFLGAICISLASSWAFGEIFGWAHSLNTKIKEVPWFYANHFFTLVTAGLVVLIPGAPLLLCRRTSPEATGISSRTFVDATLALDKVA